MKEGTLPRGDEMTPQEFLTQYWFVMCLLIIITIYYLNTKYDFFSKRKKVEQKPAVEFNDSLFSPLESMLTQLSNIKNDVKQLDQDGTNLSEAYRDMESEYGNKLKSLRLDFDERKAILKSQIDDARRRRSAKVHQIDLLKQAIQFQNSIEEVDMDEFGNNPK